MIAVKESDSEEENDEEDEATEHEQIHYIIQYVTPTLICIILLSFAVYYGMM